MKKRTPQLFFVITFIAIPCLYVAYLLIPFILRGKFIFFDNYIRLLLDDDTFWKGMLIIIKPPF